MTFPFGHPFVGIVLHPEHGKRFLLEIGVTLKPELSAWGSILCRHGSVEWYRGVYLEASKTIHQCEGGSVRFEKFREWSSMSSLPLADTQGPTMFFRSGERIFICRRRKVCPNPDCIPLHRSILAPSEPNLDRPFPNQILRYGACMMECLSDESEYC